MLTFLSEIFPRGIGNFATCLPAPQLTHMDDATWRSTARHVPHLPGASHYERRPCRSMEQPRIRGSFRPAHSRMAPRQSLPSLCHWNWAGRNSGIKQVVDRMDRSHPPNEDDQRTYPVALHEQECTSRNPDHECSKHR